MVKDKARVRARLSALFPKASALKNDRLDALAAKLKATDDSTDEEIDEELKAFNDGGMQTFEDIVKEDDKLATALKSPKKADPKEETPPEKKIEIDPNDPNAALLTRLKEMEDKMAARDAEDNRTRLHAKFRADERVKKIPASWVKNNLPATEEDFETSMTSLVEEFQQFARDNKLETFTGDDVPPAGGGAGGANNPATKPQASEAETDVLANKLLGK